MMVRAVTRVGHLALVISIVLTSWALSAALHIFYRVALWPLSACGLLDALWHHSARLRAVFALQLGEPGDGAPPSARALAEGLGCLFEEHAVEAGDGFTLALHRLLPASARGAAPRTDSARDSWYDCTPSLHTCVTSSR